VGALAGVGDGVASSLIGAGSRCAEITRIANASRKYLVCARVIDATLIAGSGCFSSAETGRAGRQRCSRQMVASM